jgi:Ribonuclease G/E
MKGRIIALDQIGETLAAALIEDGRLVDFLLDDDVPGPGAIHRAVCDRPIKGAGGMFLQLGDGQRGYMRQAKSLTQGQTLLVQVTGYAEDGKALPVTPKVIFKSRYAIVTPGAPGMNISRGIRDEEERVRLKEIAHEANIPEGAGLILRSLCDGAAAQDIAADIFAMADAAQTIAADTGNGAELLLDAPDAHSRAWTEWPEPDQIDGEPGAFERHNVHEMLDLVRAPKVDLGSGFAFIEPTRAMVAVDVNTGADGSFAAGLKANLALARDLPRQLRCRGLGGQITLDLAPMPKKDRRGWEQALKAAFRHDPIETVLAGWTPLGNYELQRKRERLAIMGRI